MLGGQEFRGVAEGLKDLGRSDSEFRVWSSEVGILREKQLPRAMRLQETIGFSCGILLNLPKAL